MSNTPEQHHTHRIFGLDILRAMAIIFVVASHGRYLAADTILYEFPYFVPVDGVDLFFVLSGLLIGTILLKQVNADPEFNGQQLLGFWKRRWLRTLPNYYLILLLNYILVNYKFTGDDITHFSWKFLCFLQNFSSSFSWFFVESWSLSIEEWFYIFAPMVLLVTLKFFPVKRAFLITVLLLIVVPCFIRYLKSDPAANDWAYVDAEFRKVVITRIDAIGYGLLAAWIAFYYAGFWRKYRFVFLAIGLAMHFLLDMINTDEHYFYSQVLSFSACSVLAFMYLPIAHSFDRTEGIVVKAITFISKISYSMYLVNLSVVAAIMRLNFPVKNTTDGVIKYFLYWIIVIVLSALIYRFFEKPIMNLRDKK
ncbi:MAG: acyltransferase [Bacteroidetes bacterium]|nr:acyltransferase [Bacteroidota bacterium]